MKANNKIEVSILRSGYPVLFLLSTYQVYNGYGNVEMFTVLGIICIVLFSYINFKKA